MRYGIDCGHNVIHDTGAIGFKKEDDLTRAVGTKVMERLKALGDLVTDCTPVTATSLGDSLYKRATVANRDNVDFFLSIHFNIGGGYGTEAYAISSVGRAFADQLCQKISSLGFGNRGVKDGGWLYVLKNTNAPAVLLEVAFVDSERDMKHYDELGPDKIAAAIVEVLTGKSADQQEVVRRIDNMSIIDVQRLCNKLGITDNEGKPLVEDNLIGPRTESAVAKLKGILLFVLK